jgi:uncharacterized membrane protein (DUF106 family)
MSWFTSIFSSGVDKVVDSVTDGLDKLFTSDEERLQLKNALQVEMNKLKTEMENKSLEYEKEVTKRWTSDNDNMVTRMVRPISYIFVLALFAIMVLTDGNIGEFSINQSYIPVIETLLATMTIAYFGSRGVEKTMKSFKGNKEN